MSESMFVRCEDCNYENLAQHSFCGMCGAKLPSPRRVAPVTAQPVTAQAEPQPVAAAPAPPIAQAVMRGSSLLGLGAEPTERERVHYLLEDEPGGGRWRGWVAVLVLAAAIGGSGWHWRAEIRGWVTRAPQNSSADAGSAPATTAAPETVPSSANATPAPATPTPAAEGAAVSTPAPPTGAPTTQTAAPPTQAVTDAVARTPEAKDEKTPDAAATTPATTQPTAIPVAPPPANSRIERKAPATDASSDALEAQGENYLYGHGVQADCSRAGKSLLAAAARSSAKAQSVLGTMYATGHCVTRDVPTAYRWFAKALHQDPGNVRIQRDLEVLWEQMTEEERKLAMQTGP